LTVCVIGTDNGKPYLKSFGTADTRKILEFFRSQGEFQAVIEATATYEWLWVLLEPIAQRLVLAHPKKVKIISESMAKTDKRDAYFLAWLLRQDAVPEAHRPSPRRRAHQQLVRHRVFLVRERTKVVVKIKSYFAARNLPFSGLFTLDKVAALAAKLPPVERFCVMELLAMHGSLCERLQGAEEALKQFRASSSAQEKKDREIVTSVPGVGLVTADVVLSTLGDPHRFPSIRKVGAYSGLTPGVRASDKTRKELPITKEGPRILRWALVEAAWRSLRVSPYWKDQFERIARRRGKKKAIVAVARRLIGVIWSLLKQGVPYDERAIRRPENNVGPPGLSARTAPVAVGAR
jgi:transposase